MAKNRNTKADPTPSVVALAARLRGGAGVHQDQRVRKSAKSLRQDKSYKDER